MACYRDSFYRSELVTAHDFGGVKLLLFETWPLYTISALGPGLYMQLLFVPGHYINFYTRIWQLYAISVPTPSHCI
jgi:hypothetical protein